MRIPLARFLLVLIVALYCGLAALFAVYTPSWQAPDEPAHYNYVRYLAETGRFPVLHMGDYPHAYLEEIKAAGFPASMSIEPIRYEFHQPPLYYSLLVPIYLLSNGNLTALRLVSVALGAGIILLAYAVGRRVLPGRPAVALGTAAFVAFLPQHLATASQVGNDVLAELLFAAVLAALLQQIADHEQPIAQQEARSPARSAPSHLRSEIVLGLLLGLISITKTTAYIALPLTAGVLAWRWWRERASLPRVLLRGVAVCLPTALIALPWYARNIAIYGWPDFLGLQRHDAIVVGQLRAADFIAQNGWAVYWLRAVEWTFKSFLGVFGWMGLWLDSRVYLALALLGGMALAGGVRQLANGRLRMADGSGAMAHNRAARRSPSVILLLTCSALLTFLAYAWYNTQFLQHQGRYLFTALIPIAVTFAVGWEGAVQPGTGRRLAVGLALVAGGTAAWGVAWGPGLPKWPVAMAVTVAIGVSLLDLALTWLSHRNGQGRPAAGRAFGLLHAAAVAFPYVFLIIVALYALFGVIAPPLTG
ncbi:MAG: hypothetical protein ACUVR4_00645 [Anaerolineae bacterium]